MAPITQCDKTRAFHPRLSPPFSRAWRAWPRTFAQVLGIAHITVKRAVLSGEIPVIKIGTRNLIPKVWIDQAIERAIEHVQHPLDKAVFMSGPREVAVPVHADEVGDGSSQ